MCECCLRIVVSAGNRTSVSCVKSRDPHLKSISLTQVVFISKIEIIVFNWNLYRVVYKFIAEVEFPDLYHRIKANCRSDWEEEAG